MPVFLGIAFPFQKSTTSLPLPVVDSNLIKQSMIQILLTGSGERLMRPTFGSGVQARVFENTGSLLEQSLRLETISSLAKWEPRAQVTSVGVVSSASDSVNTNQNNTVTITVGYVILLTRQQDSFTLQLTAP